MIIGYVKINQISLCPEVDSVVYGPVDDAWEC